MQSSPDKVPGHKFLQQILRKKWPALKAGPSEILACSPGAIENEGHVASSPTDIRVTGDTMREAALPETLFEALMVIDPDPAETSAFAIADDASGLLQIIAAAAATALSLAELTPASDM